MSSPVLAATRNALEYPFEAHPTGTTQEVAPGVLWVRMPLPFALDHINLWLVADGNGWTMVDCGLATNTTRSLWEEIFSRDLQGRPVGRVIVTHYHPDHIGLAGWLSAKFGLVPWMTRDEFLTAHAACHSVGGTGYARVRDFFARHGLDPARLEAAGVGDGNYRRGVEPLPDTFRRIHHGDRIAIGDRSWQVIVGYGHAPEHAALHCGGAALLGGDRLPVADGRPAALERAPSVRQRLRLRRPDQSRGHQRQQQHADAEGQSRGARHYSGCRLMGAPTPPRPT